MMKRNKQYQWNKYFEQELLYPQSNILNRILNWHRCDVHLNNKPEDDTQ